jgi:hypothetical protein
MRGHGLAHRACEAGVAAAGDAAAEGAPAAVLLRGWGRRGVMMVVTELVMIEQAAVVVLPVFRRCFVVLRVQVESDMRCEISGEGFGAGRGAEDINPRRAFRRRENWFFSLAQREKKEAARFVKGNDPPRTERFPATFTCNRATFTASHPFNRDRTGYAVWIDETGNGASEARAKEGDSEARLARKKG